MWTCPKCGTLIEPSFDVCWQCGTGADGVEDPSFVPADRAPVIEDPAYDPISQPSVTLGPNSTGGLVECYQALSLMEAKFLADQLTEAGIPAMSDTQDLQDALGTWQGNPHVYCHEGDLEKAREWLMAYEERRKAEHGRST